VKDAREAIRNRLSDIIEFREADDGYGRRLARWQSSERVVYGIRLGGACIWAVRGDATGHAGTVLFDCARLSLRLDPAAT
jgi:hypothetical protein